MISVFAHITPSKLPFKSNFILDRYTFSDVPDYAKISFDQCEKFLNEKPILISDDYIHEYMIGEINEFYKFCKINFPSYQRDAFWFMTLLRLFVVYDYCKRFNINEFIHLEYDNLIYSDMMCLKKLKPSIYFTRVGPSCSSAGFVYCNKIDNFEKFLIKIKQIISKGEIFARKFTTYPTISEMAMIEMIYSNTKDIVDYLPILPNRSIDNFDMLGVLFDGASYGQYIGGTNNGHDIGWAGNHHYVGKKILNGELKVEFENNKPYVLMNDTMYDIMNLHIHSKQLDKYV